MRVFAVLPLIAMVIGCGSAMTADPALAAQSVDCKVSEHVLVQLASPTNLTRTESIGDVTVPTGAKVIDGKALIDPATGKAPAANALPGDETWSVVYTGRPNAAYPVQGGSASTYSAQQWLLVLRVADPSNQYPNPTQIPPWVWAVTYSLPGGTCSPPATEVKVPTTSSSSTVPAKPRSSIAPSPLILKLESLKEKIDVALAKGNSWTWGKEQASLTFIMNAWLYFNPAGGQAPLRFSNHSSQIINLYRAVLREARSGVRSPAYDKAVSDFLQLVKQDVGNQWDALENAGLTGT